MAANKSLRSDKRNGTSTLFAALDVATGSVTGKCYQKHTHKEFLKFLKKVEGQADKDKDLRSGPRSTVLKKQTAVNIKAFRQFLDMLLGQTPRAR